MGFLCSICEKVVKMSSLPPPEEVAGPYLPQYEIYYKKLYPEGKNEIAAMDAAGFLKKSGLSDEMLGKIWDLSDPNGKGFLDKAGMFVACKMVALVQSDTPLTIDNARFQCPAPNFGADTAPGAPVAKVAPKQGGNVNFLVKPEEKRKYDALFDQLQPQEEKLPGDKVRQVMVGSKLPMPVLGQIWDLSDVDRDGFLDRYEFTVAMHLVFRALQGDKLPDTLPEELSTEKVPKSLSAMPNLNGAPKPQISQPAPEIEAIPWVVNRGDRLRFNALFKQTDSDRDGFVSGIEIKNVFLQTGLPQNILAHIWNLCDIHQEGKLNPEQFALAMWLISRKQAGKEPPHSLTPDMVPPSMRPKGQDADKGSVYNNPELEMMAKEIQSSLSEKIQIEKEIQDIEYNMSVKNTELNSLQGEFDTLSSTLKQLTNQKDVAQRRLDDLDTQKSSLNADLVRLLTKVEEENLKIEKLRKQAEDQEASFLAQEEEVHGKQRELDALKEEEKKLLEEIKASEKEIQKLSHDLEVSSEINTEVTDQIESLEEASKHMDEAMKQFKTYEETADADPSMVTDQYLDPLHLMLEMPDMSRLEKPAKPPVPQPPQVNGNTMSESYHFGHSQSPEFRNSTSPGESPKIEEAFASFEDSQFGTTNESAKPKDEEPPQIAPRPDLGDSPTPALPPKSSGPSGPKRPPPPRRPPPPGGGGASAPSRPPPPPSSKANNEVDEDPFGAPAEESKNNGGSFADFANFDSFEPFSKTTSGWVSEDSAFGSADPTPTHRPNYSALDFNDDPFKDANHRYGDPFDIEGGDPFKNEHDPFTASVDDAFGGTLPRKKENNATPKKENNTTEPWGGATSVVSSNDDAWSAFETSSNLNVVSNNLDDSFDPFSAKNLAPVQSSVSSSQNSVDPFGSGAWSAFPEVAPNSDPFSAAPVVTRSKTSADPFGSSMNFGSTPNKTLTPPTKSNQNRLQQSQNTSNVSGATSSKVSQSLSRPWASPNDPFGTNNSG